MKTARFILALILFAGVGFTIPAQAQKGTEKVTFKTDIHCENCVSKVNKNIPFEKGVKDVQANLETKEVTVTYDAKKTSKEKLIAAFEKISVKAEEVQQPAESKKE